MSWVAGPGAETERRVMIDFSTDLPGHVIDGRWATGHGERLTVFDPSTGRPMGSAFVADDDVVDAAVRSADRARDGWASRTPADRAGVLNELADALEADADQLGELEAVNAGKPLEVVRSEEYAGIIDTVRLAAATARSLPGMAAGEYVDGFTSYLRREPYGVVAAITPWNYPLLQAVAKVVPALAVGNTVVLKPSELTPLSTARLAAVAADVLPRGVLNVVTGNGALTGNALVKHPGVGLASFTGSVRAGRAVAAAAAGRPIKTILELGGNAPAVVFGDADLEAAAQGLLAAGLYNNGQECMASSRILVQSGATDHFVELLVAAAKQIVVGDVRETTTQLGPIISAGQRERIEGLITRAATNGQIALGGDRPDLPGYFLNPTVVVGLAQDAEIVQEEIFGPVFTVQTFDEEADAIAKANGVSHGLAASVWARDVGRAMRVTRALASGTVWVNTHLAFGPDLPVSGYNASGYGIENTVLGLAELTRIKHVMISQS